MNRRIYKTPQLVALFLVALLSISAISVNSLRSHVEWLADPAREGRRAGSAGAAASAQYIAGQLRDMSFQVQMQEFGGNRQNVIARSGTSERYVLLGAHYDGQGRGFASASDNAAGVAVAIEVARELRGKSLPVSLVIAAFDDEEQGLNGARYYTDHPLYPLENAAAVIILDTMGRSFIDLRTAALFVLGTEYSKELAEVVQKRARPEMVVIGTDLIGPRSDFAPFALKRVPYLFFSNATHKDYHGAGDTPDKIDYRRLAEHASTISLVIEDIARLQTRPVFMPQPVYPPMERQTLIRYMTLAETEDKTLQPAYRLMFADLKTRLLADNSRETLRVATSALLALATPSLSRFMLALILAPYFEGLGKPDVAAAAYAEASKWAEGAERSRLEERAKSLTQ
jgi:hypothetical protein